MRDQAFASELAVERFDKGDVLRNTPAGSTRCGPSSHDESARMPLVPLPFLVSVLA